MAGEGVGLEEGFDLLAEGEEEAGGGGGGGVVG